MSVTNEVMLIPTKSDIIRFWSFVSIKDKDECWICSCTPSTTYPQFYYGGKYGGRTVDANRFSYLIAYEDPGMLFVLHKCDHPSCVNPDHLFLGTNTDNMQDMIAKNRLGSRGWSHLSGENHRNAKLTWEKVREIKLRLDRRQSCTSIARKYGVNAHAINDIKNGHTWKE